MATMELDSPERKHQDDESIASCSSSADSSVMQTGPGDFDCAICFSYLRDPTLTRCGHRYCKECISQCVTEKRCCPVCNTPLTVDDIFPDNYTKRTMNNISVLCENDGCSVSIPITKFEEHCETCAYRMNKYMMNDELGPSECLYKNVGCDFKASAPHELRIHLKYDINRHLQLLLKESRRLNHIFNTCRSECLHSECCSQTETNGEFFKGKLPYYLNDVYEKLTELDQRSKADSIQLECLSSHLKQCQWELSNVKSCQRETSNGLCLWEISDVGHIKSQIQNSNGNFSVYSAPFFSSEGGYRFQLRLTSSTKTSDGLRLLIHIVKGAYDSILKWPFFGKIVFYVINQVDRAEKLEAIIDRKSSVAFQRAETNINLIGYGFPVTMTVSDLEKRGFIKNDKLIIVVTVRSFHENDFVIDLKSDEDGQLGFKRNAIFNNSI